MGVRIGATASSRPFIQPLLHGPQTTRAVMSKGASVGRIRGFWSAMLTTVNTFAHGSMTLRSQWG
jgi:hypothetical protein